MNDVLRERRIEDFWAWFAAQAVPGLSDVDDVQKHLQRIDGALAAEMARDARGGGELIVSAEGVVTLFDLVGQVVAAAPSIDGWTVVALKPSAGFDFTIHGGGPEVVAKSCWFMPMEAAEMPGWLGLRIAVPVERTEDLPTADLMWVVVMTGVGERAAGESVRHVEVVALPPEPEALGFIEMDELARYLEWWRKRAR